MNLSQRRFSWITGSTFFAMVAIMSLMLVLFGNQRIEAQTEHSTPSGAVVEAPSKGMGKVGAGIAFGLAALGAGIAVASVGAAALGVLSEKPNMIGQALMFVALGEGIVIFGFVMAFLIMSN